MTHATEGLPRYTHWADVPDELYTRTQLSKLDPPRKIAKGAPVLGRVLYHGNKYADLYALADTAVKPPPSEAQLAALAKAKQAQLTCRRCGGQDLDDAGRPERLGKGRRCSLCWQVAQALEFRDTAIDRAKRIRDQAAARGFALVDVDHGKDLARAAVVTVVDGRFETVLELDGIEDDHEARAAAVARVIRTVQACDVGGVLAWSWAGYEARWLLHQPKDTPRQRLVPWPGCEDVAMAASAIPWDQLRETYAWYVAEPHVSESWNWPHERQLQTGRRMISWQRNWAVPCPGQTLHGGTARDAELLWVVLQRMADGVEEHSPRAPWIAHPPLDTWDGK